MRNEIGIQPDDITFIGVLSACVHAGLLDYGPCLFNSLTPVFKIIPQIEHYSCMVDLLARAGEEAWDFADKIPGQVGERVINRIMEPEPSSSWNYVVSSNIYATSDRMDDSARMIGLMRERDISKTPGCSWVEDKDKVLEFYTSTEPQHGAEDMYQLMAIPVDEMR
ncbi:hypothetical protein C2845_PM18G12480 [Panicum miliaceum]|uniref:Pentatricopeptide repeat-containing protein n=1 Tax=Panicum miliaceum TaxID=4540 RepID=A0A3L6PLB6_PANMI|nr:hypothetical protein C2845_PM18G12480 [Panicum miliaceum]